MNKEDKIIHALNLIIELSNINIKDNRLLIIKMAEIALNELGDNQE